MAQVYHAALQTKTGVSLLASVPRNGDRSLPWSNAVISIPACQRKRRTPLRIACSNTSNGMPATAENQSRAAEVVLGRSSFPPDFAFGAASSAYQVSESISGSLFSFILGKN